MGRFSEWLTPDQIEQIISAVGESYSGNVDKEGLAGSLEGTFETWSAFAQLDSKSAASKRYRSSKFVADTGAKFKEALIRHSGRNSLGANPQFLSQLNRILMNAAASAEKVRGGPPSRLHRPPNDWLVGEALPCVYKEHFGRNAGRSRPPNAASADERTPKGPYINFATAVMRVMGRPITPNGIERALKGSRKRTSRRKQPPTKKKDRRLD